MATLLHLLGAASAITLGFFALLVATHRAHYQHAHPHDDRGHLVGAWLSAWLMLGALLVARWA